MKKAAGESQQQTHLRCVVVHQAEAGCNILIPVCRSHIFVYGISTPELSLITESSLEIFLSVLLFVFFWFLSFFGTHVRDIIKPTRDESCRESPALSSHRLNRTLSGVLTRGAGRRNSGESPEALTRILAFPHTAPDNVQRVSVHV